MRYSRFARWVLDRLIRPQYRHRFYGTFFRGLEKALTEVPDSVPILIAANHTSWWDAFVLLELQKRIRPGCEVYTIALQSTLEAHPFLGRVGLLPLIPGSPGSLMSLIRAIRKRIDEKKTPAPLFVFFPQGKIMPAWARPLNFQPGIELLAREFLQEGLGAVLPVGIMIEPLHQKAPSVFVSCAAPILSLEGAIQKRIEAVVTTELDDLMALLAKQGENVVSEWRNLVPGL